MSRESKLTVGQVADTIVQWIEEGSGYIKEIDDNTYAIDIEDIAYYLNTNTQTIKHNINAIAEVLEDMITETTGYVEIDTDYEYLYKRHILIKMY